MKLTNRWSRPWSVMLALAVVLAMFGAACAEDEELRDVNLALSTTSSFGYGYWIAVGLGYYEDEGLNVSLQGTGGSSDVAQILAANNAEAGMGVPGAMLPAIEQGAGLYPFFTYAYGEVFDVVVPAGSSISNIAGLNGLRIGISELAGGEVPLVRALLVEAGLDPDSDVEIIEVGTNAPSVKASLDDGRIDAYSSAKSDIASMNAAGLDTVSIAPASLNTLPAEGLLAAEDFKDDTDLLVGLGRATAKGQLVAYSNLDGAVCVLKESHPRGVHRRRGRPGRSGRRHRDHHCSAGGWRLRLRIPGCCRMEHLREHLHPGWRDLPADRHGRVRDR